MAEEARLESVYTPKAYPEFESRSLRKKRVEIQNLFNAFFTEDTIRHKQIKAAPNGTTFICSGTEN